MKLVVDELPKTPEDCIFCVGKRDWCYECGFKDGVHKHIACCLDLHGYCNMLKTLKEAELKGENDE